MRNKMFIGFGICCFLILSACSSSREISSKEKSKSAADQIMPFPVQPDIFLVKDSWRHETFVTFKFNGKSETEIPNFINSIDSASIDIVGKSGGILNSFGTDTILKFINKTDSLNFDFSSSFYLCPWVPYQGKSDTCWINIKLKANGKYYFQSMISIDSLIKSGKAKKTQPVHMIPYIFEGGSVLSFGAQAIRMKNNIYEHLPTSESFRVEIFNSNDDLVWSSNYKKDYMMVIGPVEPRDVSKHHNYVLKWNKTSNSGKPMVAGKYRAVLTIPSMPDSYFCTINFILE